MTYLRIKIPHGAEYTQNEGVITIKNLEGDIIFNGTYTDVHDLYRLFAIAAMSDTELHAALQLEPKK